MERRTVWAIVGLPILGYKYAKELLVIQETKDFYRVAFGSSVEEVLKENCYLTRQDCESAIEEY